MNLLEHYIQPGWTVTPLSDKKKQAMGKYSKLDWIHVNGKVDCYGSINKCQDTWIRSEWEDAVKQGYYMG